MYKIGFEREQFLRVVS